MKIIKDNERNSEKGFIYVASYDKLFYELAISSCETLRDYHPEADVTLYTHEKFVDNRSDIFDKVICEIPIHTRAKMWAAARTPYQKTLYNDVDTIICHKDIQKIHDHLDECDMFFGGHLNYTVANRKWEFIDKQCTIPVKLHGSMCGYHKTDLNIDFMQTWFDEYVQQRISPWTHNFAYPEWQQFDMFTLWKMTCKRYSKFIRFNDLKIKILERRWNTTTQDLPSDINGSRVITQIDKETIKKMPTAWRIISQRIKNERFAIEKSKNDGLSIQYN